MYRLLSTVLNVSLVNESNHVYNISSAGIYTNDRVYYLNAPPPPCRRSGLSVDECWTGEGAAVH